jgi:DNA-binding transcriptional MocR family regulator
MDEQESMEEIGASQAGKRLLYEEIADRITRLIEQGTYQPGKRIPSVRQMSQQYGVSISTVLQAYTLLEAREQIEARPQSGYYVHQRLHTLLPEPEMSAPIQDPSGLSLHEIANRLHRDLQNPGLVQFGAAVANSELLPVHKLNRIQATLARQEDRQSVEHIFPPGLDALRVEIAHRAVGSGCNLAPGEIVITSGCIEAVTLSLQLICREGDIVAIESPMYFGVLQTMEALRLRALEIPTHPRDGISLEALQFALEHSPVKAVLTISNFNNPLGSCMPDEKKKELVELLARYEIPLIENDTSGEIFFGERRPWTAKAFDHKGLVLLCSSFSKTIAPGYRVGWIAPGRYRAGLEWLKFTTSIGTPSLQQVILAQFLASGGYEPALRRARREYARNVSLMSRAVERHFPPGTRVTRPAGGFVLWVQMPETIDALELYGKALEAGIAIAPGHVFSASQQYRNFIRLTAAVWNYEQERGIERLGGLIEEMAIIKNYRTPHSFE